MFSSVNARSASAYKVASVEASVEVADPHRLVDLLYDALLQAIKMARAGMQNKDIPVKVKHISHAIRILEEGLIVPLNREDGGALAENLNDLYQYCVMRLISANAKNDVAALDEVQRLIEPIASSWKQIQGKGPAYLRPV